MRAHHLGPGLLVAAHLSWGCTADDTNSEAGGTGGLTTGGRGASGGNPLAAGTTHSSSGGTSGHRGIDPAGGSDSGGNSGANTWGGSAGTGTTLASGGEPGSGGRRPASGGGVSGSSPTSGGSFTSGGSPASGGAGGVGAASGIGGGSGAGGAASWPPGQTILFERSYVEFAGRVLANGAFVTADGQVYRYHTEVPEDSAEQLELLGRTDQMTVEEITAKHHTTELVATVPEAELQQMASLLEAARQGALVYTNCCIDGGEVEYIAWEYDEASDLYAPVVLLADGDICVRNLAPEAGQIADWMHSLINDEPRTCNAGAGSQCTGATCAETPPDCGESLLPKVVDGCWDGDCVSTTSCGFVPSCEDCPDHTICVVGTDGLPRCSRAGCPDEGCTLTSCIPTGEEVTCDCAGHRICAGGREWCQGSPTEGFRCSSPESTAAPRVGEP